MTVSTPPDAVRRLLALSVAAHEAVAARLGINSTDLRSLELIASEPEMTPSRLAELTGLTTGAVTGILDRLERAGFARREADPADRRRLLLRLDPQRLSEVADAYAPLMASAAAISHDWDPELRAGIERYVDALGGTLATETERLRVATYGGIVDDTYLAPLGDVARARLVLATGAPRLNLGGSALGQQVRMVAETAATRLTLRAATPDRELIRAAFTGPVPDVRTGDGTVTMRYRRRIVDTRSREITAALHPRPAWAIDVDGGITDLDADLRDLRFLGLDIRGGANHLTLRLPRPDGTVRIALAGGSSTARITRPSGVPMALAGRGGVSRLRFDDQRRDASATDVRVRSASYNRAPDRYELDLAGGISELTIDEE
jgi:DNA-binding MarR family transcriptional regulator